MKKKIKGFTLAEILGIIVIIGIVMILVAPPIIKQLNSKKNATKQTVYELIYTASSQYIKENPRQYKTGKKNIPRAIGGCFFIYMIMFQGLFVLVSPVWFEVGTHFDKVDVQV